MKTLFVVTSAIYGGNGTPEKRADQTSKTISSIIENCDNTEIIVVDSTGTYPLLDCSFVDLSKHNIVINAFKKVRLEKCPSFLSEDVFRNGFIKNVLECVMMLYIISNIDLSNYNKVVKLSGRYYLNDRFDLSKHTGITIKKPYKSWGEKITSSEFRTISSLWSFDVEFIYEAKKALEDSLNFILDQPKKNKVSDIEHTLVMFLDSSKHLNKIDVLGVSGLVDNKRFVES